ncbi:MAG: zinc-binding dehydrogenase [bacterium]
MPIHQPPQGCLVHLPIFEGCDDGDERTLKHLQTSQKPHFVVIIIYDSTKKSITYEIRMATGGKGADVAIEVSGSYSALHHAIRGVGFGGTVVVTSFYHGEAKGLRLGEEWHFNVALACAFITSSRRSLRIGS